MAEPNSHDSTSRMIDRLRNADIGWDGTLAGLVPTVADDAARRLLQTGDAVIPPLIDALSDESKFVTAHVLLTLLSGVEYPAVPWNGLEVELSPDGATHIDPEQRHELSRRWRAWERAGRPRSLPD